MGRAMELLKDLPDILERSRLMFGNEAPAGLRVVQSTGDDGNILARSEALPFIRYLLDTGMKGKIRMIYADPPFYSGAAHEASVGKPGNLKQTAYDDRRGGGEADYLSMICSCLWGMKELLSDEGLLWMHLDWHMVHYVKVLMDEIFGADNFVNEIIWQYRSGGSTSRHFARKHDTILLYSKTDRYQLDIPKEKSYNRGLRPYNFKNVEEFQDKKGWYTMVNMRDVWQIDMVGRTSAERTGYATQKPEKLLETIIRSSSREGDVCADFFCGSGTLPAVCAKTGRRFIACDSGTLAVSVAKKRLMEGNVPFDCYVPESRTPAGARVRVDCDIYGDMAHVRISGYEPDRALMYLRDEDRAMIEDMIRNDPLRLIQSWSADTSYDGRIHRPDILMTRKGEDLASSFECPADRKISLIVTDVFGGEAHWCSI